MKIIATIIPKDLVTNSLFPLFGLSYKPKKRIKFSANWWSGDEKYFCFFVCSESRSTSKAMPNSIDFYKGIFLHIVPLRIIVPCKD